MAVINSSTLGKHNTSVTGLSTEDVVTPGVAVTDPAALTSPATFNAAFDSTECDALRADLVSVRTQLIALITSLENANLIA